MSKKINVAIVGVGNCASSLVQGVEYYGKRDPMNVPGVMMPVIGGYTTHDINFVVAFDVDKRKVGKPLKEAIYAKPNCTLIFEPDVKSEVPVFMGPVLDGVAPHMHTEPEDRSFRVSDAAPVDVVQKLREYKVDILINYCPVGSQKATEFYANACLEAGVAFLNCIPVFIASDPVWEQKFIDKGLPLIGDDMRSQFGASILSAVLQQLAIERGHVINCHIQTNSGGNTDFLNMNDKSRLISKKISKTNVITSQSKIQNYTDKPDSIHAGPSEYIAYLKDNKVANFRLELEGFGGSPVTLDARLSVIDSPNSAGVVIDALRFLKTAQDLGIVGSLRGPSAWTQKTPPIDMKPADARLECVALSEGRLTDWTKKQLGKVSGK